MINKNLRGRIVDILTEKEATEITKIDAVQLRKYYKHKTRLIYDRCLCSKEAFIEIYNLTKDVIEKEEKEETNE